eukprot:1145741-Pelagomonas_calceolata.AAC.2
MLNVSQFRLRAHTLNVETASRGMDLLFCAIGAHADDFKMRSMSFSCTSPGTSSLAQPLLRQQLSNKAVFDFLLQHNKIFFFVSVLLDFLLAGKDQPQADQPNSLEEGLLTT